MSKKTYVLDTNVLLSDPQAIHYFEDNDIVITDTTLEELHHFKDEEHSDRGYCARVVTKEISDLCKQYIKKDPVTDLIDTESLKEIKNGIPLTGGGRLFLMLQPDGWFIGNYDQSCNDNKIINAAFSLAENLKDESRVILVSQEPNVRIKCYSLGLEPQEYRHERVDDEFLRYTGRISVFVREDQFLGFNNDNPISVESILLNPNNSEIKEIRMNQFVTVTCETTGATRLGMCHNNYIEPLKHENDTPFDITPRNCGQRFAIEALLAPAEEIPMVILTGCAGTAKTFLTLACGLEQVMNRHVYRHIILSRANVEFDKSLGSLPGDENEKIAPLLRGAIGNIQMLIDKKSVLFPTSTSENDLKGKVDYVFDKGFIVPQGLEYMRGASMAKEYIFIDEAQNMTRHQMEGVLTRVAEGSKIIISGDLNQIDNPRVDMHSCGLAAAIQWMAGDPLCAMVGFKNSESTRSPLAKAVAEKASKLKI